MTTQATRTRADVLPLAKGEHVCKKCNDTGTYRDESLPWEPDANGKYPPQYECECKRLKDWWSTFAKNVPPHDQHILMATIAPSNKSQLTIARQEEVIAKIKSAPTESYAFYGPAGTSKTTFCVALYDLTLWFNPDACNPCLPQFVWRVSTKYLMEEFVAYATGKEVDGKAAKEPRVNRRAICKAVQKGYRPCLYLEEIDKVSYTKFKTDCLFELIDAIYENHGQIVFNSNMTPAEFEEQFGAKDGPAIMRRIAETSNVFNFYEK